MHQMRAALLMLAVGSVGGALSIAYLLMLPSDGVPGGLNRLMSEQLNILVIAGAMGFGLGVLLVCVWSLVQRLFVVSAPPS